LIKLVPLNDGSGHVMVYRNGRPDGVVLQKTLDENPTMWRFGRSRTMHFKPYCPGRSMKTKPVEIGYRDGILAGLDPCLHCHERRWVHNWARKLLH